LIEIQKARNQIDLMRFRRYLAEQYKKQDTVNNIKVILPITTIYILGFKLPEIDSPCLKVERNYRDLVNNKIINTKSDFVEKLTHDSFIVQVDRITDKYQTRLDKLLSVFEQSNFVDNNTIIKQFNHEPDLEEVKIITDILHYTGTNPEEKERIEIEQEAWRSVNAMFEDREKQLLKIIDENKKALTEKERALTEKEQSLTEKDRIIEELQRKLGNK